MKTLNILTAIILVTLTLQAGEYEIKFDGMRYIGTVEKTFPVKDGGRLDMRDIKGDVSIICEARNDVYIIEKFRINAYSESSAEKILQESKARYLQKGNAIIVESIDNSKRYDSDYYVKVPIRFDLNVNASGGDIDVEAARGDVELSTSGGDIEVVDVEGKLDVQTSGGDITLRRYTGNFSVVTSGGDIEISKVKGDAYIKTSGGDITVDDLAGAGEIKTSGGDININLLTGAKFVVRTSGGDIGADRVSANVSLHTSGGDIIVGDVNGELEMHTSGGDIEIKNAQKNLDASTSGGDIEVEMVAGNGKLYTSGGNIDVDRAMQDIEAHTSGGDILISNAIGAIDAYTSGGNIEAVKRYQKDVSNNSVALSSSGGDVVLFLPDEIKADVFAEIVIHDRWDEGVISSDFPLKISRSEKGSRLILTGEGRINGGGDKIVLKTSDGDIKIRRMLAE